MLLAFGPHVWNPKPLPISDKKPVLAVAGHNDQCFYADAYHDAFARLAPRAEVRLIENCGHWDILVAPEALSLASDWLQQLPDQAIGRDASASFADKAS